MRILKELIGKNYETFFSENIYRKPFSAPGTAMSYRHLVNWQVLEQIFQVHDNCWLPQKGRLPPESAYNTGKLSAPLARTAFGSGRSVLIRHSEKADSQLAEVAREFGAAFSSAVDIQLYATPKHEEGFDWHYDVEEVFVIQCEGEKEFRLLPNTVTKRPLPVMNAQNCRFFEETSGPELRCLLKPGDFLYIPAGYWHKAKAIEDSFHASIGVLLPR